MKLRTRTLLAVGSSITGLGVIVFTLVGIHTYRSYRKLERQFVWNEVARIKDILLREVNQVDRTARDYANWDDTYSYMVKPNEEYISANYEAETLTNLQINRIQLANKDRQIVFDRWFNYADQQQIKQTFPKIEYKDQVGISICSNNQIFILAMHPILPSNKIGESRGWLMMARLIDQYKLDKISEESRVTVKIHTSIKNDLDSQIRSLLQANDFVVKPIDWDHVAGYTTIADLEGKPAFILEVISNRYIYQQFIIGLQFLAVAILTISICTTILVLVLLDRLFLSRLSQLDLQVQNIKANPNSIPELELCGKDELVDLSTAINQMMKVLEEARIAVATNKVKQDFMGVMSHELRTPMNAILGMAQLLQLTDLDLEQKDYVQTIVESGNDLLTLLTDILNYIRLEPDSVITSSCSIRSILNDLKDKYQIQATKKGLNLTFVNHTEIPENVITDPSKLQEILDRLIQNAIKFTDEGEIAIGVNSYPLTNHRCRLVFTIKDTGIGVKPEDIDRIFQPFTMGDNSSTRVHGGTGMGLAIVERLSEVLGATVTVESELGQGTTFVVSLTVEEVPLKSLTGVK